MQAPHCNLRIMSGDIGDIGDIGGAIGDAVSGAALAGAVEGESTPGAGSPAHQAQGAACLNCGTALIGAHCHECGQKARIHRTLSGFFHDLIHGVLHFEGKMWRTLPLLAFQPGQLTRRYIDGQRARFVSPMALFLFSVFLMFAVFQVAGISTPTNLDGSPDVQPQIEQLQDQTSTGLEQARKRVAELPANSPDRPAAEQELKELEEAAEGLEVVSNVLKSGGEETPSFNGTGIQSLDQGIIKKWRENPSLMLYKMQNNSYKFSWLLIPISIPFVWLLFFWKRRFKAYDHAIFVTYSLAFMSLLFLVLSVGGILGIATAPLVVLGLLIPPVHIYKQLKYTYDLSRFGALWRTFALTNITVFIVLIIFVWLLLLLGAL